MNTGKNCYPDNRGPELRRDGVLGGAQPLRWEPCSLAGQRVLVLLYSYYSWDPRPRREAEALARQGMEVDVICLRKDNSLPAQERINGVNIFRVPLRRLRKGKGCYLIRYASFAAAALGLASVRAFRRRYDLVHVHNMPDFLVFSGLVPRLLGAKLLLDLHDPTPELFRTLFPSAGRRTLTWLEWVEKASIRFADRVITPNQAFAELFASRSCAPEKIEVVMNSPDPALFNARPPERKGEPRENRRFNLVYHGLLAERHGIDLAVRAVRQLRSRFPDLHLHLYGDSNGYLDEVMKLVRELGVADRVHYHGYKMPHEIPAAIAQYDLGIIPNRLTPFTALNFPTRVFEYLALHKPAIVPRTRGILDYFKTEEMLSFEPGDIDDLAMKIQWALEHPEEVERILERGVAVYERHCWAAQQQRLLAVVEDLLGCAREKGANEDPVAAYDDAEHFPLPLQHC